MVIFEALNMVFGGFGFTAAKSTDHNETFTKDSFSKYCNRKSHQGVNDRKFSKTVLDLTSMVIFEVLNMVFGVFFYYGQKY